MCGRCAWIGGERAGGRGGMSAGRVSAAPFEVLGRGRMPLPTGCKRVADLPPIALTWLLACAASEAGPPVKLVSPPSCARTLLL